MTDRPGLRFAQIRASGCDSDLAVDPDTAKVTILRFVAAQDVGRDPPELRRGPSPGRCRAGHRLGAQRGLHPQRQGLMENAGFLDHRIPVASDLPMIEPVMGEVLRTARRAWRRSTSVRRWRRSRTRSSARAAHRAADVAAEGPGGDRRRMSGRKVCQISARASCARVVIERRRISWLAQSACAASTARAWYHPGRRK
jgi:hypothetical protein